MPLRPCPVSGRARLHGSTGRRVLSHAVVLTARMSSYVTDYTSSSDRTQHHMPNGLVWVGSPGPSAVVSAQSNGHRWSGLLGRLRPSWQSGGFLAVRLDGPLKHRNHQLINIEVSGAPLLLGGGRKGRVTWEPPLSSFIISKLAVDSQDFKDDCDSIVADRGGEGLRQKDNQQDTERL
ncbi:hypothetical protein EYF80_026539 [Liparis tanakae]|uniref:Uncharacterized protein n=1 Tax=Liparis tanakae TaxID=230148 RepID=A0A4Z2HBP4_9TELE|nr:hypothetical protein EYF80_026539 [Liparis tanakae]